MIISYQNKFIFLHSRKTGGSSLTALLNRFIGPKDIQIGVWEDTIAGGGKYNQKTLIAAISSLKVLRESLVLSRKTRRLQLSPAAVNHEIKRLYKQKHGFNREAHVFASDVKREFPREWEQFYKFSIVRNSWEHAVSDYHWRMKVAQTTDVSFRHFLELLADKELPDPFGIRPPMVTNWEIYTIDDKPVLDLLLSFDNLKLEVKHLGEKLNLPLDLDSVPIAKKRQHTKSFADYYDEKTIDLVRHIYRKEIEYFKYEPPF